MKKYFLTSLLIASLLMSCKNDSSSGTANIDSALLQNEWVQEIRLDNGSKWTANPESTIGVNNMKKQIQNHSLKTTGDYHDLATLLNEEKNFIVKECTMEGESHDNLHVFLHPLIEKIDALGKVENEKEGAALVRSIEGNLEGYFDYFQ